MRGLSCVRIHIMFRSLSGRRYIKIGRLLKWQGRMSRRKNMDKIINLVEQEIAAAFDKAGYDRALAKVTLSNRPDSL